MPITTKIIRVDPADTSTFSEVAEILKGGGLVAFPTETVYGLGALMSSREAVARLFRAKGRPADNPLIVHLRSIDVIDTYVRSMPAIGQVIVREFMPGPLAVVCESSDAVPSVVRANLSSVAVRVPSNAMTAALLRLVGEPIVAPSANLSGRPSGTNLDAILEDFDGLIDAVIDGGQTLGGIESTVVDIRSTPPTLLRPGIISRQQIESVIGMPLLTPQKGESSQPASPGMKYRHYAPIARVRLLAPEQIDDTSTALVMVHESDTATLGFSRAWTTFNRASLYGLFRQADRDGRNEIVILATDSLLSDEGLLNRVLKAADAGPTLNNR